MQRGRTAVKRGQEGIDVGCGVQYLKYLNKEYLICETVRTWKIRPRHHHDNGLPLFKSVFRGQRERKRRCKTDRTFIRLEMHTCPVGNSSVSVRFVSTEWANGSFLFDYMGQWELLI